MRGFHSSSTAGLGEQIRTFGAVIANLDLLQADKWGPYSILYAA
ncbi:MULTISPECIES: hypothetical protein [Clostridia]|nr:MULTISPECIES: hypothetical protein [Clostridia]